jgi:predicted ATP-grasp superfamily ATP-dependent carboligase
MSDQSSSPRGALVMGADYRALGVVRSLGRRGVPVWVLLERDEPLASLSRYAERRLMWPNGGADRVAFLCDLATSHGLEGWVLIPSTDETAALVSLRHDELARHFTHTTPPWEVVRWAYDKRLTYALADRVGVARPKTARARTLQEAVASELPYPLVLKPAIKKSKNALTIAKAWRVDDYADLAARFARASALVDPELLLVQELVPGGGEAQFSYAALCRDGVPLAALTARRTRQYPMDFGRASTFVETVDCPEVHDPSRRLLREIAYTGLIEIEYKRDPRDGVLKLLDMNPRVWGWHTLCTRAGVDFPWLLWLLVSSRELPPSRARAGVRWLRVATDTPAALGEVFARRLAIRDYARSLRRPHEAAIFAWDDPLPGLAELPVLLYMLGWRLMHRRTV